MWRKTIGLLTFILVLTFWTSTHADKTKRIVQPNGWSCLAACAAMLTNATVDNVVGFLGHHGNAYGGFSWDEIKDYLRFHNKRAVLIDRLDLKKHEQLIIIVATNPNWFFSNKRHAILWDGERIIDPWPTAPAWGLTFAHYESISLIARIEEMSDRTTFATLTSAK